MRRIESGRNPERKKDLVEKRREGKREGDFDRERRERTKVAAAAASFSSSFCSSSSPLPSPSSSSSTACRARDVYCITCRIAPHLRSKHAIVGSRLTLLYSHLSAR
ncbi:hypothetical protein ALC56_05668 [Trachymyrmex septentrionalis]|uniref:Uncharacterized protein n=1 Tax=Trachymyrmex septentrionalis TaxID=34720 RepID=A0A195FGT9_9HYME|nr:hypothetical protein ALC56_05668 [Trachymyrmex septentrionalis]